MSKQNVELARLFFERFVHGDTSDVEGVDEEFEFAPSPEMPDAGTYRGEAARGYIDAWVGSFEDYSIEATEFIDAADKVVAAFMQRGRPHGSESTVEGRWWMVLTFRDGFLVRSEIYPDRRQALEAAIGGSRRGRR